MAESWESVPDRELLNTKPAQTEIILNQIQLIYLNKNVVENCEFLLVPHQGRNAISGNLSYKRSLEKLNIRFKMDFEKPDRTRLSMLDYRLDACSVLNGDVKKNKFIKLILSILHKQKDFVKRCPVEKNKTYSLNMLEAENVQFPLPNLKFIVTTTLYDEANKERIHEIIVKGATKRK
uniref:Uncharacterized protein n=1 Tax=Musca domestica TaxID=7370 RepID=A0A1I8NL21_MUSDO